MAYDKINPSHYHGDRKHEPIEVIEDWGLNYRLGSALKYIARNGRKPGEDPREGLKKAIWYLEREIAALDAPSPYAPPTDVQYEDVLQYYGQTQDEKEAWPEDYYPFDASHDDWISFWEDDEFDLHVTGGSVFLEGKQPEWDTDEDFMWDPSLGPVELTQEEIEQTLSKKDLECFQQDEIVSTFERRGMIIGIKKDGSTVLLSEPPF